LIDNVLVFGAPQEEHDAALQAALKRLETAHVTLNSAECDFNKDSSTNLVTLRTKKEYVLTK